MPGVNEGDIYYVEIVTPDPAAVRAFYEKAFGWTFVDKGPGMGHSLVATLPNGSRLGVRAPMSASEAPITRSYIRVRDLDRAVAQAAALGAEIALERMELPGEGTIAIYFLGGIQQGLWELP